MLSGKSQVSRIKTQGGQQGSTGVTALWPDSPHTSFVGVVSLRDDDKSPTLLTLS
jgi:hypothetical protein